MMELIAKALLDLDLCFVASRDRITVDFKEELLKPAKKFVFVVNETGFDFYVVLDHNPGVTLAIANRFNTKIKYGNVELWSSDQVVFKLSMPTEVTSDLIKTCFVIAMSAVTALLEDADMGDVDKSDFQDVVN
ncbi:MAG: hypothetical protein HQM12_15145 [SAR324 cluster bacterium]|nr:hypothetical protein [SAR324 cluster bacterium]